MPLLLGLFIILLLIALNGWFAMSELALVSARRARLAVLETKGRPGAATARTLAADPQRFLPTVQIGITLISIVEGTFGGVQIVDEVTRLLARIPVLAPLAGAIAPVLVVVCITFLALVAGELVPKQLALRRPEEIAARVAGPIRILSRLAAPVVWVLGKSSNLVLRMLGSASPNRSGVSEEELKAVLAEGALTGVFEHEERDMIERLLRLADKPVRAIMTPRTELAWLDRTDTVAEITATLKSADHPRMIVCDGAIDNVVGVVLAGDLLDQVLAGIPLNLSDALRQPKIMPDSVTALDALERLKNDPLGIALVMDEYGSFEGVVTAADVLAAIVGEPAPAPEAQGGAKPADGELVLEGLMPVDELKARLALPDLPDPGGYHTLAGLLLALLRRVPRVGDRIVFGGWRFEVREMDARRVAQVRATREEAA